MSCYNAFKNLILSVSINLLTDDCGSSCDGDHGIKHIKTKSLKRIKKKLASQVNEATVKAVKEVEREK